MHCLMIEDEQLEKDKHFEVVGVGEVRVRDEALDVCLADCNASPRPLRFTGTNRRRRRRLRPRGSFASEPPRELFEVCSKLRLHLREADDAPDT